MKNNSDALNALYTLAQCAVAVYSLVMTACITIWGFSFSIKSGVNIRLYLRFMAILLTILCMVFHIIFKRWALYYVVEILLYTEIDNYSGILNLISLIYNISNIQEVKKEIQEKVHVEEKFEYRELINSSDILKRTFKKNAYLKIHFGIWFLMCMTLLIQIISIFFLKQIGV